MWSTILSQWSANPPEMIVAGSGAHARALTSVLGSPMVRAEDILAWDIPEDATVPRVVEYLHTIILTLGPAPAAADVVRLVEGVWQMVVRISSIGPDHELRWILCPLHPLSQSFVESLAAAWCAKVEDLPATGLGIWPEPRSLTELPGLIASVAPCELVRLRNRRHADGRHQVLRAFLAAAGEADVDGLKQVADTVAAQFAQREYELDVFCRLPCHPNGNRFRTLLRSIVTGCVTQEIAEEAAVLLRTDL